jgi:hypothetical protein
VPRPSPKPKPKQLPSRLTAACSQGAEASRPAPVAAASAPPLRKPATPGASVAFFVSPGSPRPSAAADTLVFGSFHPPSPPTPPTPPEPLPSLVAFAAPVHSSELLELRQKSEALALEVQRLKDNACCVVCFDRPRCLALLPCAHVSVCEARTCFSKLGEKPLCPICRKPVKDKLKVFL